MAQLSLLWVHGSSSMLRSVIYNNNKNPVGQLQRHLRSVEHRGGAGKSPRRLTALKGHFSMAGVDEKVAALKAASLQSGGKTIFDKILSKEIPAQVVYEDDKVLAFRDINPQAPTHILLIPKIRDGLTQLAKAEENNKDILGHLLYIAKVVAKQEGLDNGFRIVINDGPDGCQSVYHLHLHLIGGRQLGWPPG